MPTPDGADVMAILTRKVVTASSEVYRAFPGVEPRRVREAVEALVADGLAVRWYPEGCKPCLTLTPLAAERLGVRPSWSGEEWVEDDGDLSWPSKERTWIGSAKLLSETDARSSPDLDGYDGEFEVVDALDSERGAIGGAIDPRPGPFESAVAAEDAERWAAGRSSQDDRDPNAPPPFPTLILGCRWPNWKDGGAFVGGCCMGCGGKKLPAHAYCLACENWGGERFRRGEDRAFVLAKLRQMAEREDAERAAAAVGAAKSKKRRNAC